MLKLVPPQHDSLAVFQLCISNTQDANQKLRFQNISSAIVAAALDLVSKGSNQQLHSVVPTANVQGIVTNEEMITLYTVRFAGTKGPARSIYNDLRKLSAKCPICAHRETHTLEHFLPKKYYSELTVSPLNLVPACWKCNHSKSSYKPTAAKDTLIHPYFDNLGSGNWLIASVLQTMPASLKFDILPLAHWSTTLHDRVKFHFSYFKLATLYATEAAELLTGIRLRLTELYASGGTSLVSEYLRDEARSWAAVNPNHWRAVTYAAWAHSNWFCSGGFN